METPDADGLIPTAVVDATGTAIDAGALTEGMGATAVDVPTGGPTVVDPAPAVVGPSAVALLTTAGGPTVTDPGDTDGVLVIAVALAVGLWTVIATGLTLGSCPLAVTVAVGALIVCKPVSDVPAYVAPPYVALP